VTPAGPPGAAIHVRVPTSLRGCAGGKPGLDVDRAALGDTPTIGALLDHLAGTHPDLERRVRDEQRRLRRHVNVFLGDDNVRDLAEQDTLLPDGVDVAIIPAVSGG
jgi:molybdopterin synthase sulfur carrier subunit